MGVHDPDLWNEVLSDQRLLREYLNDENDRCASFMIVQRFLLTDPIDHANADDQFANVRHEEEKNETQNNFT